MPLQKLLKGPVIRGPGVRVPNRDRKKLEKLFTGFWAGSRDESWGWERIWSKDGKFGVRHLPSETTLNGPLLANHKRGIMQDNS